MYKRINLIREHLLNINETDNTQSTVKIQPTVTSAKGVKRRMVTIESPAKKKSIIQLWREQVILGDTIGMRANSYYNVYEDENTICCYSL